MSATLRSDGGWTMWRRNRTLCVITLGLLLTACGSSETGPGSSATPTASNNNASMNKDDYAVFPDADSGADPAVPAEQGGKGFTGEGWETNTAFDLIGDPRSVKGGALRNATTDFPTTLRYWGPNISTWNLMLHNMAYEPLIGLHPTTLEYIPALATHWQILPDKKTFRFRINPNARWSDGQPVTSADVIASWKLGTDVGLQDPVQTAMFSEFEPPVQESKYIVSVKAKDVKWQNFLYFANSLFIYPAHVLKGVDGAKYIKEYNSKMLPGTGPYTVTEQDIDKGNRITMRRRKDYWAEKARRAIGLNNFDEVQTFVVRDRNLEFEQFKKGDLDYYVVNRASMWVQELDYENIKRGLNQKRKVFNNNPNGIQGIVLNTRREPFNDIRVRKALRHLFNRESLIEKLMFNEYTPMDSIFPTSIYENPNNEKIRYDPQKAVQLLAEAGWKDRDSSGRLVKNGKPFVFEIIYDGQAAERLLTPYQEDLRKVGITANLRLITFETRLKLLDEQTFDAADAAYSGTPFPSPELVWHSKLADKKNSLNVTGFKNARADEIMDAYGKSFDLKERIKLLQELDGIITNSHNIILEWTAPYQRVVYWNKFGTPPGILTRIDDALIIPSIWWFDPEKNQKLEAALRDSSIKLGEGPSDDRYWLESKTALDPAAR
jgi:microcin C transport system substrate-binding protein